MASGEGLDDLARELRHGVGGELRADAEEGERLAARSVLRRRGLAEVATESRDRGDTVTASLPGRVFSGQVGHAASDLLTLVTATGDVHVNLAGPVVLRVGPPAASEAAPARPEASSFKARLYELELAGVLLELGSAAQVDVLRGRIRAVALDHVLFDDLDGVRWAVGLGAVHYVRALDGTVGLT